jgi:CubicO group peptidase (beta-lactamase class C family)
MLEHYFLFMEVRMSFLNNSLALTFLRCVVAFACFFMPVTGSLLPSGATARAGSASGLVTPVPAASGLRTAAAYWSTLPAPSQGLPRSTPEGQGIASADILAFVQAADEQVDMMNSFMLVRHGHVVAEGWWAPYDAETPHILYSLSKSFTSTAVGLAISDGKLSLDDQVLKFFLEDAPRQPSDNLRAMRVRDLLRMATGNQTEAQLRDAATKDEPWTRIFLAHPVPFKPGTHFLYNSPGTYMLSAIVQKVTGMTVLDYLRPKLFEPLGFKNPTWVTSPQGISAGGWGLMARTEEIARFGQLYLQKGEWQGRQLVPRAWVEEATSRQTSNGSAPTSDWDQGYGYQFWRCRHNAFRGDGAFGQYCIVIPEQDTVVAITSGVRDMQSVMNLVWDKLLPAMKARPLPDDRTARKALHAKLASLMVRIPAGRPTAPAAARISGKWYEFPSSDSGIQAAQLDLNSESPALVVRTAGGEKRTPIGLGAWAKSKGGFSMGIDQFLSVPSQPLLAASGAWTADDVFTLKIVAYETPFYSALSFRFDGDRLQLEGEHNVAFGPTKLPRLEGQLAAAR